MLNHKLKQTLIISNEKVIVLHWIAVAPYFRCQRRDHQFLAGKSLEKPVKTFFFGDHLFLAVKTLELLVKTFFFFFLEITYFWPKKPARRPRKKIWVNCSVFIWQGVSETKKVKNPWCRGCLGALKYCHYKAT